MTRGSRGTASYVVSGSSGQPATVEQWTPQFEGEALAEADSDEPVFTAGTTSGGDAFLLAAMVTETPGSSADQARLEVTTLDTSTGEPLGSTVTVPWTADDPVPDLPPCVGDRLALLASEGGSRYVEGDPVAVAYDLATGKKVFDEALAVAENASLAVSGDRVLATLASAYAAAQNTGQAPVAEAPIEGGQSKTVIGGNPVDYAYFGADPTWIPGVVGGDKQPASTSRGLDYESYTFPATGAALFVTRFATIGTVIDYWDPVTHTKLMVATDTDGGVEDAAAIDYESGKPVTLGWLPKDPAADDLRIYGFYDGTVWATSGGRRVTYDLDGTEVREATGWETYPKYAGQGWAVLADPDDDPPLGVLLPGDFDAGVTTTPLDEIE